MNYPVWQLDPLGGGLLVILIAVFHVYIAHFAVGGGLFLVLAERKAYREQNPAILDYVRRHARFFLLVTMVLGSTTGVGIWFVISLLNPAATSLLIHTFVFAWAAEWVCFGVEIVSIFLYAYTFGRMDRQRHQWLGWVYFGAAWLSLFFINGIIGFMLTPGNWPQDGSFWSGFFNPSFWPSLFFRTFFALIIAGLFGLMTAAWIREQALRTTMVRFCVRWLLGPLVFFLGSAWWYRTALPAEVQTMIFSRMPAMHAILDGFLLCAPILLLGGLVLALRVTAGVAKSVAVVLLITGQLYMGFFEFIREGGRRPYIIRDLMYSTSVRTEETPRLNDKGLLASARWVWHRRITETNQLEAGRELFNLLCLPCHSIGGPVRDIRPLTAKFTPAGLDAMISGMAFFYPAMPPFTGTKEERAALAQFIAQGLNGRTDQSKPVPLTEKIVEIPVFDPKKDQFVLLAWSDLGMRYASDAESRLALFPLGTSIRAQLVRRGERPEIVNTGVTMTYRVEGDFGPTVGTRLAGELQPEEDCFTAGDIPLLPYPRRGGFDPYPVIALEARDNNDKVVAATKLVAPVSTEMGCRTCHGGPWRVDDRAGISPETGADILAVHDRLSGTAFMALTAAGKVVPTCRECHADPLFKAEGDGARLSLSASMHGFHAGYLRGQGAEACRMCHPASTLGATHGLRDIHASLGLDCTNCHGTMEDLALGLLKHEQEQGRLGAQLLMANVSPRAVGSLGELAPRTPWLHQPDCLNCHLGFQAPATDTTFNAYTENEAALYRNRTDDSGRLFCAACHASPHAVHPADNPYGKHLDALQPLQYQMNRLPIGANRNCAVCHTVAMEDEMHHPNTLRKFRNE